MVAIIFLICAILFAVGSYASYVQACRLCNVTTDIVDRKAFEVNFDMSYSDMVKNGIIKERKSKNIFFPISLVMRVLAFICLILNIWFSL